MRSLLAALSGIAVASAVVLAQAPAAVDKARLKNPAALNEQAPAMYKAAFDTSKGKFVISVHRE